MLTPSLYSVVLSLSLLFSASPALSFNKCTLNGSVTYTNNLCPNDAISEIFTDQIIPPDDPTAAKQRYLADKKKLHQINQQKIKDEKHQQRQQRMTAHQIKKEEDQEFKCKQLELKRKSARQQYAKIKLKAKSEATEKAQNWVKQIENQYAYYCKTN